jgi:hypothetical protein
MEEEPIKVVPCELYPGLYRLLWKNGDLSEDAYNLTRANDMFKNYRDYRKNMTLRSQNPFTDAFSDDVG